MLEKKLLEYEKRFEENFPVMCFMGVSDNELEKVIDKCLLENRPYEINNTNGICY